MITYLIKFSTSIFSVYPNGAGDINGIIRTYTGINVGVFVSSTTSGYSSQSPIVVYPATTWCSKNVANSSYTLYFPYHFLQITNYTVQSGNWAPGSSFPKNWILEGSNDGFSWTVIDICLNSGINQALAKITRKCSSIGFRYFQFTHLGPGYDSSYYFCFYQIDLFGILGNYSQLTNDTMISCKFNMEFLELSHFISMFLIIFVISDAYSGRLFYLI